LDLVLDLSYIHLSNRNPNLPSTHLPKQYALIIRFFNVFDMQNITVYAHMA